MLGEVIAVEAGGLGRLQQGEPILVGLLQRLAARVDVIEDAELHVAFPPPLRRIFGRNRSRRMVLRAKPSIAAARRLSPNGRHLRLVMPGPDPRQAWQWRRSNLPSPAGLTAQVGFIRLAHSNVRTRINRVRLVHLLRKNFLRRRMDWRVKIGSRASSDALCPAMTILFEGMERESDGYARPA